MNELEQQILETWRIHQRITLFMIENIPDEALHVTLSKRGGRDISRQLAHMHNVRVARMSSFAKKSGLELTEFDKKASPERAELVAAFQQSGELMERYLALGVENMGAVSNFKRGVVPMLGYYISHEAHHRGNILLTMKQSGIRLPDALKWDIWDWNKR